MNYGIIGLGSIGSAIFGRLIQYIDNINIHSRNETKNDYFKKSLLHKNYIEQSNNFFFESKKIVFEPTIEKLLQNSLYVFLCIKPKDVHEFLNKYAKYFTENNILVSSIAGIHIDTFKKYLSNKIIRIMPNITISATNLPLYSTSNIDNIDNISIIDEDFLDIITLISGSMPAFLYYLILPILEFIQSTNKNTKEIYNIFLETLQTSLTYIKVDNKNNFIDNNIKNLESNITNVCSVGGTTIEGINYMKKNNVQNFIQDAMQKSFKRIKELEIEFNKKN